MKLLLLLVLPLAACGQTAPSVQIGVATHSRPAMTTPVLPVPATIAVVPVIAVLPIVVPRVIKRLPSRPASRPVPVQSLPVQLVQAPPAPVIRTITIAGTLNQSEELPGNGIYRMVYEPHIALTGHNYGPAGQWFAFAPGLRFIVEGVTYVVTANYTTPTASAPMLIYRTYAPLILTTCVGDGSVSRLIVTAEVAP